MSSVTSLKKLDLSILTDADVTAFSKMKPGARIEVVDDDEFGIRLANGHDLLEDRFMYTLAADEIAEAKRLVEQELGARE